MARILVTAGPTREFLDDVRYLSNASSGRMGYAIAAAAVAAGHEVLLISGPTERPEPAGVPCARVVSAREMHDRALASWPRFDVAFGVAAVADFRPAQRRRGKPPKGTGAVTLELVPNPDVIAALGAARRPGQVVVGFALQAGEAGADALAAAREKLERKRLDLCVLNGPEVLGSDRARVTLLDADGGDEAWEELEKPAIAERLVARAVALHTAREEAS